MHFKFSLLELTYRGRFGRNIFNNEEEFPPIISNITSPAQKKYFKNNIKKELKSNSLMFPFKKYYKNNLF